MWGPDSPAVLASGPATVSGLSLRLSDAADLKRLRVRVGSQPAVPASFFFGLGSTGEESVDGGWAEIKSVIHHVDPTTRVLSTRLPIPLQAGESLSIETMDRGAVDFRYGLLLAPAPRPGVRMSLQFREQMAPGIDTTMPFFESASAVQFVSLVEEITDGKPGDRLYLEGDEMIRTDQMSYPLQLGTGTEDYFNGGWYFMGPHSNPMAGQPRFIVNDPADDWSHAKFEHSLYRAHVADPIVGRAGMRFGFESGEIGAYAPIRYRTLGMAYAFDGLTELGRLKLPIGEIRGDNSLSEDLVSSAVDAEHGQKPESLMVRSVRGRSLLSVPCRPGREANGVFLTRSYDALNGDQEALVRVNGRDAGVLFEGYANAARRIAQDGIWIDLLPADCASGTLTIELDSKNSRGAWTEAGYEAAFYAAGEQRGRSPAVLAQPIRQGERVHLLDTTSVDGIPHYVNDHTLIEGPRRRMAPVRDLPLGAV